MSTPRRDFLSWLGASGAMAAVGGPLPALHGGGTVPAPVSDKWDMSWCDRLNGKVRAAFDSPAISDGAAIFRAVLWRKQQADVYGLPISDLNAVVVIRHEGIPLVMNDAYWQRFKVGKEAKVRTGDGKKWVTNNPVATMAPGTPANYADFNVASFLASGGTVLACNLAFGEVVSRFQKEDKLDKDAARKEAIAHLLPGVVLQPSGVFAVLRAQQGGCSYVMAS